MLAAFSVLCVLRTAGAQDRTMPTTPVRHAPPGPQLAQLWLTGGSGLVFAPGVRFGGRELSGKVEALVGAAPGETWRGQFDLLGAIRLGPRRRFRLETYAGGFRAGAGPFAGSRGVRLHAVLGREWERIGLWVGGGVTRASNDETEVAGGALMGGVSTTVAGLDLALALRAVGFRDAFTVGRDTVYVIGDFQFLSKRSQRVDVDRRYADAELRATRTFGVVTLLAGGGVRITDRFEQAPETWARVGAQLPVVRHLEIQLAAGRQPGFPERRTDAGGYGMVGFRWTVGGSEPPRPPFEPEPHPVPASSSSDPRRVAPNASIRSLDAGIELLVRDLPARRVELKGDPTDWQSLPLEHVASRTWRLVLPLGPGTYRVNLRVNGGPWGPLPGHPAVRDEFGGVVGIIVVE